MSNGTLPNRAIVDILSTLLREADDPETMRGLEFLIKNIEDREVRHLPELNEREIDLLTGRHHIPAIKAYRERVKVELRWAKRKVDDYAKSVGL